MKRPRLSNEEFKKRLPPNWFAEWWEADKENAVNDKTKSTLKAFAAKHGHWLIIIAAAVGVYLYSGGDEDRARELLDTVQDIAEQIEGIEATLTEPTGLECVSEEP